MKFAEKICTKCAERVKRDAVLCRFCGHEFTDVEERAYQACEARASFQRRPTRESRAQLAWSSCYSFTFAGALVIALIFVFPPLGILTAIIGAVMALVKLKPPKQRS